MEVIMIHTIPRFLFAIMLYRAADEGAATMEDLKSIFFRLYVGETVNEYIDYPLENISELPTKIIDSKPTVLYIHGFTENLERESVRTVVQAYLKRGDHNVIGLDYGKLANETYMKVVKNAPVVGNTVAISLNKMVQLGFDSEKLHIVAHSMGAQVAGHIGRKANFTIPRITGLDPAGPLFNILEDHLTSSDARFVDIIHTDRGFYGIFMDTGTVNFFPNGGSRIQPGCPQDTMFFSDEEFCSHHRSWRFYAESVTDESAFLAVQCSSLSLFSSGKCNNNSHVIMGYATPTNTKGNIYLVTNSQSPFGMHEKGAEIIAA